MWVRSTNYAFGEMMFEYKYVNNVRDKKIEEVANEHASAGWRLMSVDARLMNGSSMDLHNMLFERDVAP